MATKQEKLIRLNQLIRQNPTWGYRKLNKQLKVEFGSGLGTGTGRILRPQIKAERITYKIPEPTIRKKLVKPEPRQRIRVSWKTRKNINALSNAGFLPFEIREMLSTRRRLPNGKVIKVEPLPLNNPMLKEFIRERAKGIRRARRQGLSQAEIREMIIENMYGDNDFFNEQGNPDFWQEFRQFEEEYKTKHPEYARPPKKRRDFISKEDLEIQRRRRENQRFLEKWG